MLQKHYIFFRGLHLALDLCVAASLCIVSQFILDRSGFHEAVASSWLLVHLLLLALALSASPRAYQFRFRSFGAMAAALLKPWGIAAWATLAIAFLRPDWIIDRRSVVVFLMGELAGLLLSHILSAFGLRWLRKRGRAYRNALIVGTGHGARQFVDRLLAHPEHGVHPIGFLDDAAQERLWSYRDIPVRGTIARLPEIIKSEQIDYVVFSLSPRTMTQLARSVRSCTRMGVTAIVLTDWFDHLTLRARARAQEIFGLPGLVLETAPRSVSSTVVKEIFDRSIAALAIILSAPLMIAAAVAVKLSSPGRAVFSQVRLGRNGRPFTMWKFRTMVQNAEALRSSLEDHNEMSGPVFKMNNDPRVTVVGRFLRRTSLDELPQLFNVLKGDMSLVGPRPPLPSEVKRYRGWERRRLAVKPGISCLWQVQGRSNVDFDDWMRLDLKYIDNWSIGSDAAILLKTIPAVLKRTGAK